MADCPNYGCLTDPIPAQVPDPNPVDDVEAVDGVICRPDQTRVFERVFAIVGDVGCEPTEVDVSGLFYSDDLIVCIKLIPGHTYLWIKGANDISVDYLISTFPYVTGILLNSSGTFLATDTDFLCGGPAFQLFEGIAHAAVTFQLYDLTQFNCQSDTVSDLVKSWNPEYICTNGNQWPGSSLVPGELDMLGVARYRDFIFPYHSYSIPPITSSSTKNNFYPSIGNHDQDPVGRLDIEIAQLNIPPVFRSAAWYNNAYYNIIRGNVEHFFYHSGYNNANVLVEPDGNDVGSDQYNWLIAAAQASTARWKILHFQHASHTSTATVLLDPTLVGDGYLNYTAMRNVIDTISTDFPGLFDLVTNGHCTNYERSDVNGLPIICNGLGGAERVGFGAPRTWSVVRYSDDWGAQKITTSYLQLKSEFISLVGTVQDSFVISKS